MNDIFKDAQAFLSALSTSFAQPAPVGDNHWMTVEELQTDFHRNWLRDSERPWLKIGTLHGRPVYLSQDRLNCHVLLLGAQAAGRTAAGLAGLFRAFADPTTSLVFFDPDAELIRRLRKKLAPTHSLYEIAPGQMGKGLRYNPLAHIPVLDTRSPELFRATQARQQGYAYALARVYVQYVLKLSSSHPPLLGQHAQDLIAACILHLCTLAPQPPFYRLTEFFQSSSQVLRHLLESPCELARSFGASVAGLDKGLRHQLLQVLTESAVVFQDDEVRWLTSANEVEFTRLLDHPTAIFYTLPPFDAQRWQPLTAMLYQQLTAALLAGRRTGQDYFEDSAREPNAVRIILDKPQVTGPLPGFPQHLLSWPDKGLNLSFLVAVRSRAELETLYGEDARALLEAIRTHLLLPGLTPNDCETYSRYCGQHVGTEPATSTALQPLISPAALARLQPGHALLYTLDGAPALLQYLASEG